MINKQLKELIFLAMINLKIRILIKDNNFIQIKNRKKYYKIPFIFLQPKKRKIIYKIIKLYINRKELKVNIM